MNDKRPSRVAVAHIYAKRIVRWRRNSYPFISGDAFADFSDFVYKAPNWRTLSKTPISEARVIFARSEDLQEMLDAHSHEIHASVIISGNSDYEFHKPLKNLPKSVMALFLQNSYISDDKFYFSIPIGIENFRWGVNGNPRFLKERKITKNIKEMVLFGPLGKTHPIREEVRNVFPDGAEQWDFLQGRIKPQVFDKLSKQYSHIAAVRGNGVDTHRLWESLYRGIIPIVEKSQWWDSLEFLYPEVEVIESWTPKNVREILSTKSEVRSFRENPALWMPFWESKIKKFVD